MTEGVLCAVVLWRSLRLRAIWYSIAVTRHGWGFFRSEHGFLSVSLSQREQSLHPVRSCLSLLVVAKQSRRAGGGIRILVVVPRGGRGGGRGGPAATAAVVAAASACGRRASAVSNRFEFKNESFLVTKQLLDSCGSCCWWWCCWAS